MAYTRIPANGDVAGIVLLLLSVLTLILAAVAIILRVWVRHSQRRSLVLNDWLLFIAWFFSLALTITIVIFVGWSGLGQQETKVSPDSIVLTFQLLPAAESLWAAANTATKVSILLVYKEIFVLKSFRLIADSMIAIIVMLGLGATIQSLAICRPFAYQWDRTIEGGVCGNRNLGILLVAFLNLATDLAMVIMPLPLLWSLKMPRTKKLFLMGMFGIGIIICIITVLRIIFTFVLIQNQQNATYWIGINAIFLTLEPNLGMVNACLLLLKPILQRFRPRLGWASNNQSTLSYPLDSNVLTQPRKGLSNRYVLKSTTGVRKFRRMYDDIETSGDLELKSVTQENLDIDQREGEGSEDFIFSPVHPENQVIIGQGDATDSQRFAHGITITRTLDLISDNRFAG